MYFFNRFCFNVTNVADFDNFDPMQIQVLLFGITRDIVDRNHLKLDMETGATTEDLKVLLHRDYPDLANYQYALAVNEAYANDEQPLQANDQVALIPPVSGG